MFRKINTFESLYLFSEGIAEDWATPEEIGNKELVTRLYNKYGEKATFDFLGIKNRSDFKKKLLGPRKRGRPAGYKGVIQKSGSKITPADLEIIIGLNLPQDKDVKITQPNHALYGKVIKSIPHSYKDYSRGLNVREIKKYMEKFPHKFTDPSVSEREINMTLQKAGINPGKGYGNF